MEEDAFYALVDKVTERVLAEKREKVADKWLSPAEAMKKLGIRSPTTLQRLRNEGKIRYSQPFKKVIHYDSESIDEYLERHARETF